MSKPPPKTSRPAGLRTAPRGDLQKLLRLMQLVSPTLPIGGYTYSHGLEWAVEAGWVSNEAEAEEWIAGLIVHGWSRLDLPILLRMTQAIAAGNAKQLNGWCRFLQASRESRELQAEDRLLGEALDRLLTPLEIAWPAQMRGAHPGFVPGFALAVSQWEIPMDQAAAGYLWTVAENQVLAAVKLVPLGQTAGQRILFRLATAIEAAVPIGLALEEDEIGFSNPGLAIASALHETQYTRLFRS